MLTTITTAIRRSYDAFERPVGFDWWIYLDRPGHRRESWSSLTGSALETVEAAIADMCKYLQLVEEIAANPPAPQAAPRARRRREQWP